MTDMDGMLFTEIPDHQIDHYHNFEELIPQITGLNFYRKSSNVYIEMMGLKHYKGNPCPTKTSLYSVMLPLEIDKGKLRWFVKPLHRALQKYNGIER